MPTNTNRIKIHHSILVISKIIGVWTSFLTGFLAVIASGFMGAGFDVPLFIFFCIPLLGTILTFLAWRDYDKEAKTISHRGFIFVLLPYIIMVSYIFYIGLGLNK